MAKPPARRGRPPRSDEAAAPITIRLTDAERADFQGAAEASGRSLAEWMRMVCTQALVGAPMRPAVVPPPVDAVREPLIRWTVNDLVKTFPGTAGISWRREYIPELVRLRALHKNGRAWFGKRSEIESAMMTQVKPKRGR